MAKFTIYKDLKNEFRWRFIANNGQIIADSGEGYTSKENCKAGINFVKTNAPNAPVYDQSGY